MTTDDLSTGETQSVHVRISGQVQGVGFRAWTERQAKELGLSGWVRNEPGGDVEAVFRGPAAKVQAMLAACREGPKHAVVQRVDMRSVEDEPPGPFVIRS